MECERIYGTKTSKAIFCNHVGIFNCLRAKWLITQILQTRLNIINNKITKNTFVVNVYNRVSVHGKKADQNPNFFNTSVCAD